MKTKPPSPIDEVGQLREELAQERANNRELLKRVDELSRRVASLQEQLDQTMKMLRRRDEQVKRLERENRGLRRKLGLANPEAESEPDPAQSPQPPEVPSPPGASDPMEAAASNSPGGASVMDHSDGLPPEESDEASPQEPGQNGGEGAPPVPTVARPKPRPRSRGGRRPPPAHLPNDEEFHTVDSCGTCGCRVFKRDVLETTVYSVVPSYVRKRTIRRERVICSDSSCNRPTTAAMPPMPCKRGLYDCSFLAWLVVQKFEMLVPLDRIRSLLASQGVDLAMGTLVHLIERASDLLGPVDGQHMKLLEQGPYMGFDATGLKVLVPNQKEAWDAYLEVFTRDELSVFRFDLTKHADELGKRIENYQGILLCDAESRNAAANPHLIHANCNAHPLRKFKEAAAVQPELALEGSAFIQSLYRVEDMIRLLGLSGPQKADYRKKHCTPVLDRFRVWLIEVIKRPLPPSDPVMKVSKYYLKHFDNLTRFVKHPELPIDNNISEREFQKHAKLRYASLFAGSPEGGHRWATILGVVRTAQKCHVDVMGYLKWVFERRGSHRRKFGLSAAELTPMAWRDQGCPGATRAKAPLAA